MQSQSMSVLRSAARRAAGSCSRRGLATTAGVTAAEKESVAALVQKEVRSQLRGEEAASAKAARESAAALVQEEVRSQLRVEEAARTKAERERVPGLVQQAVRDRLCQEERLRKEGELRAKLRSHKEAAERGTDPLRAWKQNLYWKAGGVVSGAVFVNVISAWIQK